MACNLQELLESYKGTSIVAPIAVGVRATNRKMNFFSYNCHCSSDDCAGNNCYDCHCSSDDCVGNNCYDCHCSSDDCGGNCFGPSH